jgi:hypothetical protein
VRAAGGAAQLLAGARAAGVELVEVDFGAVFAGSRADLAPLIGSDPIVERALMEVLRFREGAPDEGEALEINLDQLASAESLGGFLDELIEAAEPGVRREDDRDRPKRPGQGPLLGKRGTRSLDIDEVAELAADAFFANQDRLDGEQELVRSAQVLADALVRLTPQARFALLRRLAGQEGADQPGQADALGRLASSIEPPMLIDALAGALFAEGEDSEVVKAVGNVLRRLRPVEAERADLLGLLDRAMSDRGKPMGGMLWQEVQARALEQQGLGMLELNLGEAKLALSGHAEARRRGRLKAIPGQEVLSAIDGPALDPPAAVVLIEVLRDRRELHAGTFKAAQALIESLEQQGQEQEAMELLGALVDRAEIAPAPLLSEIVQGLLGGPQGERRSMALVRSGYAGRSRLMAEVLLRAIEGADNRRLRDELLDRLSRFEPETLEALGELLIDATPVRISLAIQAGRRAASSVALSLARAALKNPHGRAKDVALKSLIDLPSGPAIALLGAAAGAKGEEGSRRILHLPASPQNDRRLLEMQLVAVGALGLTRVAEAVPPLVALLTRTSLISNRTEEDLRAEAARALATNGSPEAMQVLAAGAQHKKKNIREACERALASRGGGGGR